MVMAVSACSLLFLLAVGSIGVFNLHFSTGLDQREHARNVAESVIHLAIAKLQEQPSFGVTRAAGDKHVFNGLGYPGPAKGTLTYDDDSGQRYSTNNLEGKAPTSGDRAGQVPAHVAHLIGKGRCGDVVVHVECLYSHPPFPEGVSCTGLGNLTSVSLMGLSPDVAFAPDMDLSALRSDKLTPANVYTGKDLLLKAGCFISGDAAAREKVRLSSGAVVGGEVRHGTAKQDVPKFDPGVMITRMNTVLGRITYTSPPAAPVTEFALWTTPVLNIPGDLVLDGGVLAVDGDLVVGGTVKGRGAVIVKGDATLKGGTDVEAGRQVALVAGRDVSLEGTDREDYFFQGILAAGRKLVARQVTVLGSIVCNDNGDEGEVHLDNVRVLSSRGRVATRFGTPITSEFGPDIYGNNPDDSVIMRFYSVPDPNKPPGNFLYYGTARFSTSRLLANGLPGTYKAGMLVRWSPGISDWQFQDGAMAADITIGSHTEPYDGTLASLKSDLRRLLAADRTNPSTYFDRLESELDDYMDQLVGKRNGARYFDFNLNKLMAPTDSARILLLREI